MTEEEKAYQADQIKDLKLKEEILKAERAATVQKLATLVFSISHASGRPLSPHEAFQRAEAFVAHCMKLDPEARVFIP